MATTYKITVKNTEMEEVLHNSELVEIMKRRLIEFFGEKNVVIEIIEDGDHDDE